jgi:hypothetical protein
VELKAHFGLEWWPKADEALRRTGQTGIPPETSRDRDKKHPHMDTPETDPLWFISFDSLLRIVFDDQLWPLFECYLTTKELLQAKFTEIAPIRNRIAHCRPLHKDDQDRLRRLLRDLDQGFWHFCTSYNKHFPILGGERSDAVYQRFADRMGFNYVEVKPNEWALVGNTIGMSLNVSVERAIRPSADAAEAQATGKGKIYHLTFTTTASNRRSMDYQKILEYTERYHQLVVHMILDSFQNSLRVTFPAPCGTNTIIEAAEGFYYGCANMSTYSYRDLVENQITKKKGKDSAKDLFRDYELYNRPFEAMASQWPHYVLPPGHPFEVLYPDCPCSFFEA